MRSNLYRVRQRHAKGFSLNDSAEPTLAEKLSSLKLSNSPVTTRTDSEAKSTAVCTDH